MSQFETMKCPRWNPANVKLVLQDTQHRSNVWISMPNHCVWTCFWKWKGTHNVTTSFWQQKTSFLLTGGFTEGGQAACFGSASSRRTSVLDPDCGNLDQLTRESLNCHVLNNILPQCRSTDIRPCLMWRMSAKPLGFPSLLGMIKSCFSTYL